MKRKIREITPDGDINYFLPEEIWRQVFRWVDQKKDRWGVSLACKKWHRLGWGALDPSVNDNAAIRWASENGHAEVVRLLLEDGRADPTTTGEDNPIRWASTNGHWEVVELLLGDIKFKYIFNNLL